MIQIVIVGISADPIEFLDGSDTKAVTEKLMGGFGKGLLKQRLSDGKWVGVLSATLEAGEYAYHVTAQGKTKSIICSNSFYWRSIAFYFDDNFSVSLIYFDCFNNFFSACCSTF